MGGDSAVDRVSHLQQLILGGVGGLAWCFE